MADGTARNSTGFDDSVSRNVRENSARPIRGRGSLLRRQKQFFDEISVVLRGFTSVRVLLAARKQTPAPITRDESQHSPYVPLQLSFFFRNRW